METQDHLNQIVQNITDQITSQVQANIAESINQQISAAINGIDIAAIINTQLSSKLDIKLNQLPINSSTIEAELNNRLADVVTATTAQVQNRAIQHTQESVARLVSGVNFPELCQAALNQAIEKQTFEYPSGSIPASAVDFSQAVISGDNVTGGIIKNFGSTGIEDQATACQLTIMDDATVVENNLLTQNLTVKGTTTIEGDLHVTGTLSPTSTLFTTLVSAATNNVQSNLNQVVFASYADMVYDQIKNKGLDLGKITLNGQDIVVGSALSVGITNSNLQTVGVLQSLQVQGEGYLSQTLYTNAGRVGINTVEPDSVLSVWDQEVEISMGKQSSNTGIIQTNRNQTLIVGANGKNNLTLTPDGATTVAQLNIGQVTLLSSAVPPTTNMAQGTIVFNANPTLGGPLGWVSLGDARWANFGLVD